MRHGFVYSGGFSHTYTQKTTLLMNFHLVFFVVVFGIYFFFFTWFFHSHKRPLSTDGNSHISIELCVCGERDKRTICKSSLYRLEALFFVLAPLAISSNEVSKPIETPYIVLYFQDKGTAHQFRKLILSFKDAQPNSPGSYRNFEKCTTKCFVM